MGTCVRSGKLHVPNMKKLGLYNIDGTSFCDKQEGVIGCYAKMQEKSAGKDTTVGHWEIAGVVSETAMPTYPNGFPKEVIGVGKIYDIFAGRGVQTTYPNKGNDINMERALSEMDKDFEGLCFVNLVDFDMLYGHRNDIEGYTNALNKFDVQLGQMMEKMREDDLLIITADHGCDPGFKGTDHSREFVPCLCYGHKMKKGINLGLRGTFSDIAHTIAEFLGVSYQGSGESFPDEMRNW